MRILVGAEAFGYGPASKLTAICAELGRAGVVADFKGLGVSLGFAQANSTTFRSIEKIDQMTDLGSVSPRGYSGALSVMDPFLVLWAAFHDIQCVYIDSLYWFWTWPATKEEELQKKATSLLALRTVQDALNEMATITMHDAQYIAHYLATKSCVQRALSDAPRSTMPGHTGIVLVEAIVDLSQRSRVEQNIWLSTTSGLLNPLVSTNLAVVWTQSLAALLTEATNAAGVDEPVIIAGNPEVLKLVACEPSGRLEIKPLNRIGLLRALNSAIGCLTPPGLTTLLEAAAYGVPLILLPEQHYAHLANYELISRRTTGRAFPEALIGTRVEVGHDDDMLAKTEELIRGLATHCKERTSLWHELVDAVAQGMSDIRADRTAVAAAQDAAIRRFVRGYNGTSQVSAEARSLFPS